MTEIGWLAARPQFLSQGEASYCIDTICATAHLDLGTDTRGQCQWIMHKVYILRSAHVMKSLGTSRRASGTLRRD